MTALPDSPKPTLLVLSTEIKPSGTAGQFTARHAVRCLIDAGRAQGFRILSAPYDHFSFELRRSETVPRLRLGDQPVRPDAAIIRITGQHISAARIIDRVLRLQGCVMLDAHERFSGSGLGKIEVFTQVQGKGADTDRLIVLTLGQLERWIRAHDFSGNRRMVVKPAEGFGGTFVRWVDGTEESIQAALEMARGFKGGMPPMIVEPALNIAAEYRIYTLDGEVLGAARRVIDAPDQPANASQGAELVEEVPPAEVLNAIEKVRTDGLIGWDVAVTQSGNVVIIERNRPPSWRHFAKVSEVDIAGAVIASLKRKVEARAAEHRRTVS